VISLGFLGDLRVTAPGDARHGFELRHGREYVLAGQIGFEPRAKAQRLMSVKQLNVFDAWVEAGPGFGIHEQGPDRFRRGCDLKLVREMDRAAAGSHVLRPFDRFPLNLLGHVILMVCREGRHQRHPQKPAHALVATEDARLQPVRRRFHLVRELEDVLPRTRQTIARGQLLEHACPDALLQLGDASQHRGVVNTKAFGSGPH
jgi:hypothetical protein